MIDVAAVQIRERSGRYVPRYVIVNSLVERADLSGIVDHLCALVVPNDDPEMAQAEKRFAAER